MSKPAVSNCNTSSCPAGAASVKPVFQERTRIHKINKETKARTGFILHDMVLIFLLLYFSDLSRNDVQHYAECLIYLLLMKRS